MSHQIYTTEALVLGSEPVGEANRRFWLLTRSGGLLRARAQGIRLAKSKLAGQLLSFNHVEVSLVRGREEWLIIGAQASDLFTGLKWDSSKRLLAARVCRLLVRLLAGEDPNPELFGGVKWGLAFLAANEFTSPKLYHYELVIVLRILANLGYIGREPALERLVDFAADWRAVLAEPTLPESAMILAINEALRHSHL